MGFLKKSSLGGDALVLTLSNFTVSLLGVVTSMLLSRFRTLTEYGTYSQIIMVTDLVSTILLLGLPGCVNYFIARADTEEEKQKFLTMYLTLSTAITFVIAICLFFATPLIIQYFNNPYISTFAYIFAIYPWASIMLNSLGNVCIVYGRAKRLVVFNIVHSLTTLSLLLLAKALNIGFYEYTLLYIGSMLFFAVFGVLWMRKMSGGLQFSADFNLVKTIFAFSIPLGLASSVGTLNAELDKLIIGKFFTTDEYAIFANAAKQLPVTMLASSLTAVLMPKLVRLLKDDRREETVCLWGNSINISLCFMCLIVGGFVVFAPDVMSLFYSEKYVTPEGVAVFRIYSIILLFRATYWGIVLNATGRTKLIFISSLLTLLFNCIGNIGFYYAFGFIGPALSTLVVTVLMGAFQLVLTSKQLQISMKHMFPWGSILKMLATTSIVGAIFWGIKYFVLGDFVRSISILISIGLGVAWLLTHIALNFRMLKKNWESLNA